MLDTATKKRIDDCRDILVGKLPDPKSQIEQITIALIYKFMDDMDKETVELGGKPKFFSGEYAKYGWAKLFDAEQSSIDMVKLYEQALEQMELNPNIPQLFRDIFKNAYLPYRDPETLKLFLKTIGGFEYTHSEKLGDAFEYLLSVMGSQGDAGQFRTPRHIIDFIVEVVNPEKKDKILDPACGTSGFLVSAYKHILKSNEGKLTPDQRKHLMQNVVGYDISPDMVRLALVNLYLHGFSDPHIFEYDTLSSEERWNETYDVILANPPFMTPKGGIRPHKKFGVQSNRSEVLFVDYIAEHLNLNGRAGVIVPEGIIFQSGTAYKSLRKMLVENYLWAVISLPAGIFQPYSGVKTSVLLMDKTLAKKTNEILFVKIESDGFDLGAQRRENNKSDLPEAVKLLNQYRNNLQAAELFEGDTKNVFLVEKNLIAKNADYNLSIDRYRVSEAVQQSNFEMVRLGDVCDEIFAGGDVPKDYSIIKTEQYQFPIYSNGIGDKSLYGYTTIARVKKQCVSISARGTIGYPEIRNEPFFPAIRLIVAIPKPQVLNYRFLKYVLQTVNISGTGNTIPQLTVPIVKTIEIPLPPLSIQEQIVSKIEGWQKVIDGAKQVVESYKPQIDIDESWEMVKLGEVCEITSSKRIFQNEYVKSGVPFYRTKEIVELNKGEEISLELFISEERYNELKSKFDIPQKGDLLVSAVGTIGIMWVVADNRKFYFKDGNIIWVKNLKGIDPTYLKFVLETAFAFRMAELTNGAAYSALTIIKLKQLEIPFPPLSTQQSIVIRIEQEQQLVNANKELIQLFEQKIKDEVGKLWKGGEKEYALPDETVSIAAEE